MGHPYEKQVNTGTKWHYNPNRSNQHLKNNQTLEIHIIFAICGMFSQIDYILRYEAA